MTRRIDWLDYGRFAATCAVVLFHYLYWGPLHGKVDFEPSWIARYGYFSIDFFFMVSGYVIARVASGRTASQFAWSRLVRIYPAFVVCMSITAAALALTGGEVSVGQYLVNLTAIPNVFGVRNMDGPYWTLYFEFAFYAAAWGLLLLRQQKRLEAFVYGWIALQVVSVAAYRVPFFSGYFTLFAAGCLFAFSKQGWTKARIAMTSLAFLLSCHEAVERALSVDFAAGIAVLITSAWFSAFIVFRSFNPALPGAPTLGAITYPVYLLHCTIGMILLKWLPVPAVIAVVLVIAYAVTRAVDYAVTALITVKLRTTASDSEPPETFLSEMRQEPAATASTVTV